jgi:hypothetical protein
VSVVVKVEQSECHLHKAIKKGRNSSRKFVVTPIYTRGITKLIYEASVAVSRLTRKPG